jgi:lipoprotein-anchoring transpeptidase ErfK/SrfK
VCGGTRAGFLHFSKFFLFSESRLARGLQSPFAQALKQRSGDAMKALATMAMAAVMAMAVPAAMAASKADAANTESAPAMQQKVTRVIVVSLKDRKLALVENGEAVRIFPVAVGKPSTPSPTGTFTIERRVKDPIYHHDGRTVLPGPGNPVGTRWMGLSKAGYGIHGTNEPMSIGKAASHGCIRMAKPDLEELYALVRVGDTVELIGQRNEETARLFADPKVTTPAPAQPLTMAQTEPAVTTPSLNAEQAKPDSAAAAVAGAELR